MIRTLEFPLAQRHRRHGRSRPSILFTLARYPCSFRLHRPMPPKGKKVTLDGNEVIEFSLSFVCSVSLNMMIRQRRSRRSPRERLPPTMIRPSSKLRASRRRRPLDNSIPPNGNDNRWPTNTFSIEVDPTHPAQKTFHRELTAALNH